MHDFLTTTKTTFCKNVLWTDKTTAVCLCLVKTQHSISEQTPHANCQHGDGGVIV